MKKLFFTFVEKSFFCQERGETMLRDAKLKATKSVCFFACLLGAMTMLTTGQVYADTITDTIQGSVSGDLYPGYPSFHAAGEMGSTNSSLIPPINYTAGYDSKVAGNGVTAGLQLEMDWRIAATLDLTAPTFGVTSPYSVSLNRPSDGTVGGAATFSLGVNATAQTPIVSAFFEAPKFESYFYIDRAKLSAKAEVCTTITGCDGYNQELYSLAPVLGKTPLAWFENPPDPGNATLWVNSGVSQDEFASFPIEFESSNGWVVGSIFEPESFEVTRAGSVSVSQPVFSAQANVGKIFSDVTKKPIVGSFEIIPGVVDIGYTLITGYIGPVGSIGIDSAFVPSSDMNVRLVFDKPLGQWTNQALNQYKLVNEWTISNNANTPDFFFLDSELVNVTPYYTPGFGTLTTTTSAIFSLAANYEVLKVDFDIKAFPDKSVGPVYEAEIFNIPFFTQGLLTSSIGMTPGEIVGQRLTLTPGAADCEQAVNGIHTFNTGYNNRRY
ncbi:MAG: hypothetical protein C0614_11730, partial [Desulfuromonas sp.]